MAAASLLKSIERYLASQLPSREPAAREELQCAAFAASDQPIRRILVAVDHDDHPTIAAAIKIAAPLDAKIAIVSVMEPSLTADFHTVVERHDVARDRRVTSAEMLARCERRLPPSLLDCVCLREGNPATEILAVAKDYDADLIIMGTHRHGAIARLFLGSSSHAVLRLAHCPVLLVADPQPAKATPKKCAGTCCARGTHEETIPLTTLTTR